MRKMKQTRILLVDDNRLWLNTLKHELCRHPEMEVAVSDNGIAALETIKTFRADIVLSGVVMRNFDGFALADSIRRLDLKKPKIMFMSLLCNDDIIKRAAEAGVTYFFRKPLSAETIYNRIKSFTNDTECTPTKAEKAYAAEVITGNIIKNVGIPVSISGYKFIRDSIIFSLEHENEISRVTKSVYPAIAEKYGTKSSNVERSIRTAIETAWNKPDKAAAIDIFGNSYIENKPTNGEFIAVIADKVRLDLKKSKYMH